jgi:serine protease
MNLHLRRIPSLIGAVALVAAFLAADASAQELSFKTPFDPLSARAVRGRVIVKLTPDAHTRGVVASALAALRPELGVYRASPLISPALAAARPRSLDGVHADRAASDGLARFSVVEYSALVAPQEIAAVLSLLPDVEYAEPIYPRHLQYATDDPGASQQWYLDVIGARSAWDDVRADSTVVIAVVDAGIDPTHEDLAAALWHNTGEMGTDGQGGDRRSNGVDDDANGYVDDWQGYDFAGVDGRTPDNDPDPARESHGTEMAGIAGAIGDNGRGTVGVAFGARLMSLKITNEPESQFEGPDLFNTHEGILYAAKMGADVINCSWGDLGRMRSEQEVIDAAVKTYGAVIVASAGNSSNNKLFYPASYDGVLSVGAVENGDGKANFSNYNYRVDLSAPGTFIYAPDLGSRYRYGQGTSHAAAVVSGAAALVRSKYPALSPAQVVELLRATTDDNNALLGEYAGKLGTGRLNVLNSMIDGATINSARVIGHTVVDASGDGILDPGEAVTLRAHVENFLAPSPSVTATLSAVSAIMPIEGADVDFGAMETGETETTPDGFFRFTVPSNAEVNSVLVLKVVVRTTLRTNETYIALRVAPSFMTTELNRISATFNGSGNIAYHGTDRDLGDGFRALGGRDLIYHAGLIVGTSATRLSDAVRIGSLSSGTAEGFQMTQPYRVSTAADGSVEIGRAAFNDAHRDSAARVGVDVTLQTYEYADERDRDYVLVVYTIRNASGVRLDNLHAGLYIDWDVSTFGEGDVASLDEAARLGYVSNALVENAFVGAALVSGQPLAYNAVDNNALGITSSFTAEQKWQLLGNGIGTRTTPETDAGMVIGAGPFALDPGATTKVAFMLAARTSLDSLRAAVARATERFGVVASVGSDGLPGVSIAALALPNPTSGRLDLAVTLEHGADVVVRVLDAAGREALAPFAGRLESGKHRIAVDGSGLADGSYFYEVVADDVVTRGAFVKIER